MKLVTGPGAKKLVAEEHYVVAAIKSECSACTWSAPRGAEGSEGAGSGQQEGRGGVFMPRGGRTARGAPSPVLW